MTQSSEMQWKFYQEGLLLHAQLERYDLLTNSRPAGSKGHHSKFFPEDCGCSLPNKKYCMLNVQPVLSHLHCDPRDKQCRKKYVWVPMSICSVYSSSSTPTVPYSTADILYGNEVRHSPQLDEIRQNSFIDFTKERERQASRDLGDRRPSSNKGGSRKSLSIEKVSFGKDSDDNIRPGPTLPSTKHNQYRPNGLRNTLIKGEQLFSSRSNGTTGRETDDLVAMGTIWSPNTQSSPAKSSPVSASVPNTTPTNLASSTASGTMQSVAANKTISVAPSGSYSSTAISTRKYGTSNVRPIMVQNVPTSRNIVRDAEPKYTDPLIGAPASFQQRLMELSALEAETVRYEKNKRVKKKVKQDRDS